jgi:hypothetical protein
VHGLSNGRPIRRGGGALQAGVARVDNTVVTTTEHMPPGTRSATVLLQLGCSARDVVRQLCDELDLADTEAWLAILAAHRLMADSERDRTAPIRELVSRRRT